MDTPRPGPKPDPIFAPFLALIADAVAERVLARIGQDDTIDQHTSPAGPRRYIRACRVGELRATRVGRRWVSLRRDHDEWFAALAARNAEPAPRRSTAAANVARILRGKP